MVVLGFVGLVASLILWTVLKTVVSEIVKDSKPLWGSALAMRLAKSADRLRGGSEFEAEVAHIQAEGEIGLGVSVGMFFSAGIEWHRKPWTFLRAFALFGYVCFVFASTVGVMWVRTAGDRNLVATLLGLLSIGSLASVAWRVTKLGPRSLDD